MLNKQGIQENLFPKMTFVELNKEVDEYIANNSKRKELEKAKEKNQDKELLEKVR